jgi:hypothetical protein
LGSGDRRSQLIERGARKQPVGTDASGGPWSLAGGWRLERRPRVSEDGVVVWVSGVAVLADAGRDL